DGQLPCLSEGSGDPGAARFARRRGAGRVTLGRGRFLGTSPARRLRGLRDFGMRLIMRLPCVFAVLLASSHAHAMDKKGVEVVEAKLKKGEAIIVDVREADEIKD